MTDAKIAFDLNECREGSCCKKVTTMMFDNADCSVPVQQVFSNELDANHALDTLVEQARAIESEPCTVESNIETQNEQVVLNAVFSFCCQAEAVLFQLALR